MKRNPGKRKVVKLKTIDQPTHQNNKLRKWVFGVLRHCSKLCGLAQSLFYLEDDDGDDDDDEDDGDDGDDDDDDLMLGIKIVGAYVTMRKVKLVPNPLPSQRV